MTDRNNAQPMPFERSRFPYSDEAIMDVLPPDVQRLLDFGCSDGGFLGQVKGVPELAGCDIDAEAVEEARLRLPNATFCTVGADPHTPFEENSFDAVTLLSVLEHVPDERALLAEIHRILKPGGYVVVLVPHKGLFSFADPGNIKFRFPRLHKLIHLRSGRNTPDVYVKKFGGGQDHQMVGCHSNRWHGHYSVRQLQELLDGSFDVKRVHGFCLITEPVSCLDTAVSLIFRSPSSLVRRALYRLTLWDRTLQPGHNSAYVLVAAQKIQATG